MNAIQTAARGTSTLALLRQRLAGSGAFLKALLFRWCDGFLRPAPRILLADRCVRRRALADPGLAGSSNRFSPEPHRLRLERPLYPGKAVPEAPGRPGRRLSHGHAAARRRFGVPTPRWTNHSRRPSQPAAEA